MRTSRILTSTCLLTAAAAAGLLAVLLVGSDSGSATATATQTATATSTTAALKKAKWGSNVTVTFGSNTLRFRSDGIPNHARPTQYALPNPGAMGALSAANAYVGDDPTAAQSYDFTIPTRPKKATTTTATALGVIGVTISGATLFNPYEGDGTTVATSSNFTLTAADGTKVAFLDSCNGHPTPRGQYHYHALPPCLTKTIDKAKGPSHILGVAFDGYPIYGNRDIRGRKVAAAKLDKCNGIFSATPEFPKGIYHYVLLNTTTSNSSIRCFRGVVDSSLTQMPGMPGMAGMPGMGPPAQGAQG